MIDSINTIDGITSGFITAVTTASNSNVIYMGDYAAEAAVTPKPKPIAAEDSVAWLRRRVEETCWRESAA